MQGKRAFVLLAEGFEEIEAMTLVDVLRRAGVEVETAALGALAVTGAHGVEVRADRRLDGLTADGAAAIILPGGLPGATNLRDDARVLALLRDAAARGVLVAAICAAPMVLAKAGLLEGKRATAYPGVPLPGATRGAERVVEDGNVMTSQGPGTTLEFALALAARLAGPKKAAELREALLVQ